MGRLLSQLWRRRIEDSAYEILTYLRLPIFAFLLRTRTALYRGKRVVARVSFQGPRMGNSAIFYFMFPSNFKCVCYRNLADFSRFLRKFLIANFCIRNAQFIPCFSLHLTLVYFSNYFFLFRKNGDYMLVKNVFFSSIFGT